MDDVENIGVSDPQVAIEATDEIQQDQQITESSPQPIEDRPEINWKKEMERKEQKLLAELDKREQMLERLISSMAPKAVEEVDELDSISDEEYIPKGKQKKLVRKELSPLEKKLDELEKRLQEQAKSQWIDQLRRKYPDFDQVVNPATLELLDEQEPELAQTIASLKDPYTIGIQSYKFIKASGILEKTSNARRAKEVEKKLEKNAKTVQSPQAFDKRPMAQAFEQKDFSKELYEEMMGFARQAGGY